MNITLTVVIIIIMMMMVMNEVGRLTEGGIGRRRLVTLMAVERK